MKKVIVLLFVCGFAFAFVACGGKKEAATEETTTAAPADTTTTAPADTTKTDTTASK